MIIDHGVSIPVYGREGVDGLKATAKTFIFQLMATVKLPGSKGYDTQMIVHSTTSTDDVSVVREFQKHFSNASHKHVLIDQVKFKKLARTKKSRKKGSIVCRRMLMLSTKLFECFFLIKPSFHHYNLLFNTQNHMVS